MTRRVTRSVEIHLTSRVGRRAILSLVFVDGRLGSAFPNIVTRESHRDSLLIIRAMKRERAGSASNCCARHRRTQCSFLWSALFTALGIEWERFALDNQINLLAIPRLPEPILHAIHSLDADVEGTRIRN